MAANSRDREVELQLAAIKTPHHRIEFILRLCAAGRAGGWSSLGERLVLVPVSDRRGATWMQVAVRARTCVWSRRTETRKLSPCILVRVPSLLNALATNLLPCETRRHTKIQSRACKRCALVMLVPY